MRWVQAPTEAPLRVDFAGGWLDVPRFSRPGEFIVNCAISPLVSLREWPYEKQAGLGGSGAWALLNGRDGVESEIDLGVGWQDPAVIRETGLCVWRSGTQPVLDFKHNGDFLIGRMAISGPAASTTLRASSISRATTTASRKAPASPAKAPCTPTSHRLAEGVKLYHATQLDEGMDPLPEIAGSIARKYCGGGHGGYALYLFDDPAARDAAVSIIDELRAIEPFCRV